MTTTLRRATVDDCAVIHQLLSDMATADGAKMLGTPETLAAQGFGAQPRFRVILALAEAPLGLVLYFPEYSSWRGQMGVFVQDLYLAPMARGQGLGRALLAAALHDADWGAEFLSLNVAHKNTKARAFYQALGMVQRDTTDPLILTGEGLAALIAR